MTSAAVSCHNLDGTWELSYGPSMLQSPEDLADSAWPFIPATVPGNVELDLLASGIITDPYVGDAVYSLRRYEGYQWWYSRAFETPLSAPGDTTHLVFDGIDCFSTVWLNGVRLGSTDNMLIPHQFDVTDLLIPDGENKLVVRIDSAVNEGRKRITSPAPDLAGFRTESYSVRKAPHSYGWDISPRVISAGLWRSVYIEVRRPTRFRSVYWRTARVTDEGGYAALTVDWDFVTHLYDIDELRVVTSLTYQGSVAAKVVRPAVSTADRVEIKIDHARLWWPRGEGDPALYEGKVELQSSTGEVLDVHTAAVGVRTIQLIRSDVSTEQQPGEFFFKVNGVRTFIRGTNWVHLDCFHSRDAAHTQPTLAMAADLNCNMIRCWGGNVYENDDFYDTCDKIGIMVWQDFSFACALYPQDDDFAAKVWEEAVTIIGSLRHHPSLALWAGDNEVDALHFWNPGFCAADPNRNRVSREILAKAVYEHDPSRPYLPSSPFVSPAAYELGEGQKNAPEQHLWGPRGYYKDDFYAKTNASFVSEIGYHGCPAVKSLNTMFDDDYVYPWVDPDNASGKWNHQWQAKAVVALPNSTLQVDRNELMRNQIRHLFGDVPDDLSDFVFASQAVQAEAMKYFIEFFRTGKWRRSGIIWWNLRDGWPILSDAVTDYYYRKKLAYAFIKNVQQQTFVAITDQAGGRCNIVLVNDLPAAVDVHMVIKDVASGEVVAECDGHSESRENCICGELEYSGVDQGIWSIHTDFADGNQHVNHYLRGNPPFDFQTYRRLLANVGYELTEWIKEETEGE